MTTALRVTWITALALTSATNVSAQPGDARAVVRCQTRIARAAERVVRQRQHALTVCLDATETTCHAAVTAAEHMLTRLTRAATACLGRTTDETLGLDGIGWEALAPVCPDTAIASLGDAIACLERALPCAADVAMTDAIPEAVPRFAERGIMIDRRCLDPTVCGDDLREGMEECDDGNLTAGDGCDATCHVEVGDTCGDGILDPDEECDDGAENSDLLPDHCRTSCLDPYCGDGVVDPDEIEECEPPGTATCDEDCVVVDVSFARATAAAEVRSCESALGQAVARVTRKVQRQVDGCALALARCSLVDDDPSERCLVRAERRCRTAAARRALTPGRVSARLAAPCTESAASITTRLERAACAAEAAVSRAIPRADELMLTELVDLDGDDAFPCVLDLAELE